MVGQPKPRPHLEAKRGLDLLHVAHDHAGAEQGLVGAVCIARLRKQHEVSAPLGQLAKGCVLSTKLRRDGGLLQSAMMPRTGAIALRNLFQMWSERMLT